MTNETHRMAYEAVPRMFQSNPAMDAMTTDVRTRLVMYAIGGNVEDHEGSGKACDGSYQPSYAALLKNSLAHGLKHRAHHG